MTPRQPAPSRRPHLVLLAGLTVFLVLATLAGGWVA